MRYVIAKYNEHQRAIAYRIYVTDTLFYMAQGKAVNVRYVDLIKPKKVDKRTGDEIALDVITRLNLKVGQNE